MAEKLKDRFFTPAVVDRLAKCIKKVYPDFDASHFRALIYDTTWEEKELKARMRHISHAMQQTLPSDYEKALDIIEKVAPSFSGFDGMIFPDFVECFGIDEPERSLKALEYLTRFSSSEFAIRPFLLKDTDNVLVWMSNLAESENHHVRRFASEGCRPGLPWAMAVPALRKNPHPMIEILEKLRDDESEYVRKSVANHLNDISKDYPELVLKIAARWQGQSDRTNWIIKRACRTLLKAGDPRAMVLFGFTPSEALHIDKLRIHPAVLQMGETVTLNFDLRVETEAEAMVRIEYAIDFVKAKGKTSRKVFHITETTYPPGTYPFSKSYTFRDRTTRKHYPGSHQVSVIINGVEKDHGFVTLSKE